jgi:hypothetical protein
MLVQQFVNYKVYRQKNPQAKPVNNFLESGNVGRCPTKIKLLQRPTLQ